MDACNPGINTKNLVRLVRQETGMDLNLTRNQVCDAYKSIQDGKLPLPPMVLSKDGKYMLDRKSPLTGDDFEVLLSSSSKSDELKRVARKVGLSKYKEMTKVQLVDAIENVLKSKGVREPIRLHITARKEKLISVNSNNNYQNNFNVNNRNGNGINNNNNLKRISNESSNIGNGNRENGNRQNGNRQNGNGASRTTRNKYYMNAMARRVRGEQPAPSRRSNDPAMTQLVNAFQKSKTSGPNSDALRRALERAKSTSSATNTRALAKQIEDAMKRGNTTTLNALRKKLAVPVMSEKDGKVAKLEKYIVNKGRKLNDKRRITFMNEAQKSIKAYKNGTNMYETAEARIAKVYENAYKTQLNDMGTKNAIDTLQENVNTIGNEKIKSSAREKLNAFKQSGGTDTSSKNAVIKLQKLDEELKLRKKDVNRDYLNEMRDEALKNINSYNIENGLAKIKTRVKEDMKKRGAEFNTMIANDMYKNVPSNVKTTLRNKYVSGKLNSNGVKQGLNNALEESAGVYKGFENKIANLEKKLGNSKLTANEINKLQANLKQATTNYKKLQNEKNRKNAVYQQLRQEKLNSNKEIENLKQKLQNDSISKNEKNKLQANLNQAIKNQFQSQKNYQKLMTEMQNFKNEKNRKNALYQQLREEKLQSNKNLKAESNKRQQALKKAAEKEAEITKKLGERNASIKNLTEQRAKLLEKGELNAAKKANLKRIRKELTGERNAKNNEISRLQTLSENRENALKEISTKLNEATRSLARSEGLISTQKKSLEAKNKNLKARQNQVGNLYSQIETLTTQATQANEEIKQQTTKLATSASEINRLQKKLTNATKARTRNINNMQMRHAENIRAATAQIQELTKNVQERNAIIQRSKVTGQWKGAAVRGLGTQLKNTRTNLTRAQKEIGVARNAVNGLRGQRKKLQNQLEDTKKILGNTQNNLGQLALAEQRARGQRENLRRRNAASQKVITGLTQQRQNAQRGINQLRATTRNLEQKRLAANRATNKTFNASAAFNRQMKGVAPRQSWQSLKPKATMVGAVQADVLGKRLREKLLKNIDTTNISGKFVINGGPFPGSERRALKKDVRDPMTRLNKLRAIEKMIFNRKTNRNSTILPRRRMNKVLNKQGTNVKPVNPNQNIGRSKLQGFAASGLNQKTISDVIRRL